jgi:hypothetical protein
MNIVQKPNEAAVTLNTAELAVVQFVLSANGETFTGYMQQYFDLAISNMEDLDEAMRNDTIVATNYFLKLMRAL